MSRFWFYFLFFVVAACVGFSSSRVGVADSSRRVILLAPPLTQEPTMTRITLATLCLVLSFAASAQASMPIGVQDDEAMKYHTTDYLQRADNVDAQWVRLMVPADQWGPEHDAYIAAAQAARADHKHVMVSLLSWNLHPSADQWQAFAKLVVPALAPYVDAWSPMNEPNQPNMAPATPRPCTPLSGRKMKRVRVVRYRHVRHHRGHYRRTVRRHRHHRVVRYQHTRHGDYNRKVRHVMRPRGRAASGFDWCSYRMLGRAYRRVWNVVAPTIHELDPTAMLIAGDLAPWAGAEFMDGFFAGRLSIRPKVLGIHPYADRDPHYKAHDGSWRAYDIEEAHRYAAKHHLRLWATEWAVMPDRPDTEWAQWLGRFRNAHVKLTVIYDTQGTTWNTQMRATGMASVRAFASAE